VRATQSVPAQSGYVLTEKGRLDIETSLLCHCNPRLSGLLIQCPECGTIYGTLRDSIPTGGSRDKWRSM
jgi:hypothetical protein